MSKLSTFSSILLLLSSLICQAAQEPTDLKVTEVGYMSILLEWTPHAEFGDVQVIERKGPNDSDYIEHLKLPHGAWRYKDLGLDANSYYQYRIKCVSPDSESNYAYVAKQTEVNTHTTVFNVRDYGATGNGTSNDTEAIRAAIAAVTSNGGGIVYFPTGTYAVCPDEDDPADTIIFVVTGNNITLRGDGPGNSIISCYSPGLKDPETEWSYDTKDEIRRGSAFSLDYNFNIKQSNVVFEGLRVTGNCRPTGDANWWTNEQRITGWDIRHKGLYFGAGNDNILIRNCVWDSWRGEIIYSGDPYMKKVKLENSKFYNTNSSAISTSADFECDNIEVWDAANACIESAFYHNLNGNPTGTQMGIFRNSIFEPRRLMLVDPEANPILIYDDMGKFGAAAFNSENSYMSFQGCTFTHARFGALYFAVAQHNVLITESDFIDTGIQGHIIFVPQDKTDYQMTGGIFDVLIDNNSFTSSQFEGKILNTCIYNDFPMQNVHFVNNDIKITGGLNIVFQDAYQWDSGRENFLIANNTITETPGGVYIDRFDYDIRAKYARPAIAPLWKNNTYEINERNEGGGVAVNVYSEYPEPLEISVHGPYKKLHDFFFDTYMSLKNSIDRYPEGFEVQFIKTYNRNSALFAPDAAWNDLAYTMSLSYRQTMTMRMENGVFRAIKSNGNPIIKFNNENIVAVDNPPASDPKTIVDYTGLDKGEIGYIYLSGQDITISNKRFTTTDGADIHYDTIDGTVEIKVMRDADTDIVYELDRTVCDRRIIDIQ